MPRPTSFVRLFAAGRRLDGRCLPVGAVHVHSFGLETASPNALWPSQTTEAGKDTEEGECPAEHAIH